jgi:hypothetical protein
MKDIIKLFSISLSHLSKNQYIKFIEKNSKNGYIKFGIYKDNLCLSLKKYKEGEDYIINKDNNSILYKTDIVLPTILHWNEEYEIRPKGSYLVTLNIGDNCKNIILSAEKLKFIK